MPLLLQGTGIQVGVFSLLQDNGGWLAFALPGVGNKVPPIDSKVILALIANFNEYKFKFQESVAPSGMGGGYQPPVLVNMGYKSKVMTDLTKSQAASDNHKPVKHYVEEMEKRRQNRFATILALVLTINCICPSYKFPKKAYGDRSTESKGYKTIMYEGLNVAFYHNLKAVCKLLNIPESTANCTVFTAWNKVGEMMNYLKVGVFDNWSDHVGSNKTAEGGKTTAKSKGFLVNEFFFLYPLIAGSLASAGSLDTAKEFKPETVLMGNSGKVLAAIAKELNILKEYPITTTGKLLVLKSTVTSSD